MGSLNDFLLLRPIQEHPIFENNLYRAFISRFPDYRAVPPHYHSEIEIIAASGVKGEMHLDGKSYSIANNGVYAIRPNAVHSFRLTPQGGGLVYVLQVNTEECGRVVSGFGQGGIAEFEYGLKSMSVEHPTGSGEIADAIKLLSQIARLHHPQEKTVSFQDAMGDVERIYRMLRMLTSGKNSVGLMGRADVNIHRIIDGSESLAASCTSRQEIGRQSALSKFHMCRIFKRATGMTIQTYLNELRVNRACRMLSDGTKNVTETCFECGFENLSYFIQVFRKKVGMAPKQWALLEKKKLTYITGSF